MRNASLRGGKVIVLEPQLLQRIVTIVSLLLFAPLVSAGNPWAGVWRGTLGELKITVCINSADSDSSSYYGSYYYDRYQKP